ncbi:MAG: protoporphyrinogen oxidase HemJ [Rhodospirillales bacterium]
MSDLYTWLKTLHILSVIAWMAGMLYLPRLYVYHAGAAKGSELSETFKTMERRLLRGIINPAMMATWTFGLLMVWQGNLWEAGWLHAKLVLVLLMSGLHGFYSRWRKDFANDANRRDAKFYRIMNELPFVLLIGIVILVVFKPF